MQAMGNMSNVVAAVSSRFDAYMERGEVQRFRIIASSISASAAAVALVALAVFTVITYVALVTLGCMVTAGALAIPAGLQIGLMVGCVFTTFAVVPSIYYMPDCIKAASDLCKETHWILWNS